MVLVEVLGAFVEVGCIVDQRPDPSHSKRPTGGVPVSCLAGVPVPFIGPPLHPSSVQGALVSEALEQPEAPEYIEGSVL